jgi:hypothetical protein
MIFRLRLEKGWLYVEFLSGLDWSIRGGIFHARFPQLAACSAGFLLESSTLKMEAICSSEGSGCPQTTRR